MTVEELIKKIQEEKKKAEVEAHSADGLARLQEVAAQYDGEYRLLWSDELVEQLKDKPRPKGYKMNVQGLDELTGGFRPQQLVTVTAHSAHGKTSFGMFLASQMEDLKPVVIPIEQTAEELVAQRLDNNYSVPRFLYPEHLADMVSVDWIEERVIEGIAKFGTKMVVIDHLGYIDNLGEHRRENLAYRIGMVMKGLKGIAKRWDVVIVLLAHISQHDEGKPPSLEDIGNSSDIVKESDLVMLLWRKNHYSNKVRVYENKTLLSIQKNRFNGKNGNVGLIFDTENGFYNEENSWVRSLEKMAEQESDAENAFENF